MSCRTMDMGSGQTLDMIVSKEPSSSPRQDSCLSYVPDQRILRNPPRSAALPRKMNFARYRYRDLNFGWTSVSSAVKGCHCSNCEAGKAAKVLGVIRVLTPESLRLRECKGINGK